MRSMLRFTLAALPFFAAFVHAPRVDAQAIPIPFASTYAGLAAGSSSTTVCSTGIPIYATTGTGANYGDGCLSTQASISAPIGVAIDKLGNLFIADQTHNLVRVVYNGGTALANAIIAANVQTTGLVPTKGNIYTIVGGPQSAPSATSAPFYCSESSATGGPTGLNRQLDGCQGVQAYDQPRGIAVDNDGNVFISNLEPTSSVRVFYVGGAAAAALITTETPGVIAPQPGFVYPIAGSASAGYSGDGSLAVNTTSGAKGIVNTPRGLAIDSSENIYFADQLNNVIRRVDGKTGIITTIAGHCVVSGTNCTATASSGDGAAATDPSVNIDTPYGVAIDQYGNIFIAEGGVGTTVPGRVRMVYEGGTLPGISNPTVGNIYTYAGGSNPAGTQAQQATFQLIYGVSLDQQGYLYATEYRSASTGGNHVYRIDPVTGNMIVFAGTGGSALANTSHCERNKQAGLISSDNYGDNCPSTQAYLNTPQGPLAFDSFGNSYLADRSNNVVRKFTYNNVFPPTAVGTSSTPVVQAFYFPTLTTPISKTTALQGQTTTEFAVGTGTDTCPIGTIIGTSANTCTSYVTFTPAAAGVRMGSYSIADATGTVATETLTGVGVAPVLTLDPTSSTALGSGILPEGVSTDLKGNVYLSDGMGKQVLRASLTSTAGTAVLTGLGLPRQSATDSFGNLFVADSANNAVVELTAAGVKMTVATTGLSAPQGIVADRMGNLIVADTGNNRLVYFSFADNTQTVLPTYPLTLSAPTQLFLDANANLFVIDSGNKRLVEFATNQLPVAVALPAGAVPSAVAEDLGGNLYVADLTTGTVLTLPVGATTGTTVVSNLSSPVGLALDPAGDLFVADSSQSTVSGYNRTNGTVTFGTTNIGNTSLPVTLNLSNFGNAAAALSTPPYVETGTNASAYVATTPATCTAGLTLNAGASCTQSFSFKPTATTTPQTAQVTFSATTGQTASSNFTATATNIIPTSLSVTGPTGQLTYGQTANYTVTLTPQTTGTSAPTGSITFAVNGRTVSTATVGSSPYTYAFSTQLPTGTDSVTFTYSGDAHYASSNNSSSITIAKTGTTTAISETQSASGTVFTVVVTPAVTGPLVPTGNVLITMDGNVVATIPVGNGTVSTTKVLSDGPHTYSASYTGDANYLASASTSQNLTISRAPTQTTLTIAPATVNGVSGETLTATVTSTTAGTPTGSVTFFNGTTAVATITLPASGVVTNFVPVNVGAAYSLSATYSGDGLYQPSTGTAKSDFAVVSSGATLNVVNGSQASTTLAIVPLEGYAGTFTASCAGLPANAICRFQPAPLTASGTTTTTLTIQVFTGIRADLSVQSWFGAVALLALLVAAYGRRRRLLMLCAVVSLMALPFVLGGCSSSVPGTEPPGTYNTPAGTSVITVNLTDASGTIRTGSFTLNVISNGHD